MKYLGFRALVEVKLLKLYILLSNIGIFFFKNIYLPARSVEDNNNKEKTTRSKNK